MSRDLIVGKRTQRFIIDRRVECVLQTGVQLPGFGGNGALGRWGERGSFRTAFSLEDVLFIPDEVH